VSIKGIPLLLERERIKKDEKDKTIRIDMFSNQVKNISSLF